MVLFRFGSSMGSDLGDELVNLNRGGESNVFHHTSKWLFT